MKWFSKQQRDEHTIEAEALSARLPEILLEAQHLAQTIQMGVHGRRTAGMGDQFWQYRPYDSTVDAAKRIDWRQSARGEQLYVREREDERAQTVHLWLDPSSAMHYTSEPKRFKTKFAYGFTCLLTLAYQLTAAGERVVCTSATAGRVTVNHPRDVVKLANALLDCPRLEDVGLDQQGMYTLCSDFLNVEAEALEKIALRLRAQPIPSTVLVMADPMETRFDFDGHIKFEDMTASDEFETQNAKDLRVRYLDNFRAHQNGVERAFGRAAVQPILTDRAIIDCAMDLTLKLL